MDAHFALKIARVKIDAYCLLVDASSRRSPVSAFAFIEVAA
jgi:hypothetical protein